MKLKRDDLAKQFEDVVKQEVKTHNDEVLAMNVAMNALREKVDAFPDKLQEVLAKINVSLKNIELDIEKLEVSHDDSKLDAQVLERSVKNLQQDVTRYADEDLKRYNAQLHVNASHEGRINGLEGAWDRISANHEALRGNIYAHFKSLENLLYGKIESSKSDILSMPSEAQAVKADLTKTLDMQRIDFAGVMEELKAVKKQAFVQEKKIEQIYVLLDRLDKKFSALLDPPAKG